MYAVGIPIEAGALYPFFGIRVSPIIAAAPIALSSLSVVTNANRLRGHHTPALPPAEPISLEPIVEIGPELEQQPLEVAPEQPPAQAEATTVLDRFAACASAGRRPPPADRRAAARSTSAPSSARVPSTPSTTATRAASLSADQREARRPSTQKRPRGLGHRGRFA